MPPDPVTHSAHPRSAYPRGAHPLEVFPVFRRWRPSAVRDLVYTAVWSSLIGLGLSLSAAWPPTGASMRAVLGDMVPVSNLIGLAVHAGLAAWRRRAQAGASGRFAWSATAGKALLIAACTLLGIGAALLLLDGDALVRARLVGVLHRQLPVAAAVACGVTFVLGLIERRHERERAALLQSQKIAEAGQLLAEARLRALQAQVEPHFLYNTLANVVSLIGSDPARARHMVERLIDFLRASLAASRAGEASLGAELDLVGAYLDVLAVRMGARLRYRIELDPACRDLPVAPMLIQPLVENAVMHGIEPKVEGGEIVVQAGVADGALVIEVSDDGVGLGGAGTTSPRPGGGVGLANLRERLRSLHGAAARVELLENAAGGLRSRLLLPLTRTTDPSLEISSERCAP